MSTLYVESAALAAEVRLVLSSIARRDQDLARRLKRACDDVPLHVEEGMCHTGRTRRLEYGAALGSAREALACVRAAESVGYLREGDQGLSIKINHVLDRIVSALAA
jgi:four helix bundle protein